MQHDLRWLQLALFFGSMLNAAAGTSTEWMILMTVNHAFFDFFQNWWMHYKCLNLKYKIVVVAEDDVILKTLSRLNLPISLEKSQVQVEGSASYGHKSFKGSYYHLYNIYKNINIYMNIHININIKIKYKMCKIYEIYKIKQNIQKI
eukprot:g29618.t1